MEVVLLLLLGTVRKGRDGSLGFGMSYGGDNIEAVALEGE